MEWILLAAVLAVPVFLFVGWRSEIKNSAAPATKPMRIITVAAPKVVAPANEASRRPIVAARLESPAKPPEPDAPPVVLPSEPVLLAMRDPMLSPYDRIAMIVQEPSPQASAGPPSPPPPPRIDAGIRLEGVILTEDQPRRVIVNGAVLEEGESVKGAKVLRIETDGVMFGRGRKRFTKRLRD